MTHEVDLHRLRRRSPEAVERWFLAYADPLYAFVFYRVGRCEAVAAEVVQETFLNALRKIGSYDPERGAIFPWLTYLARNCIRSALRRDGRTEEISSWEEIDRELAQVYRGIGETPLPDEVLERRETAELVRMTLSNLPDDYRQALDQHYRENESVAEMASARGTTEGAVKSLLHRARLAFKSAFETVGRSMDAERRVTS